MQKNRRYPKLFIRSKNELAKHISHERFSKENALTFINDATKNFERYWKDSKKSDPKKEKHIRNARGTPLGQLLGKINTTVLAPHDDMIPEFIFGGIGGRNHVKAARHLVGTKKKRAILKIDLKRFFEQIAYDQVVVFFRDKCHCDERASRILANLCCVPIGPKNSGNPRKTIARGFSTSPRLAVWCNLDFFIRLNWLVLKKLKGKDPRIAIYVDDIGITASRVSKNEMYALASDIEKFLLEFGLVTNEEKKKISSHEEGIEYVGIRINRNTLSIGAKAKSKRDKVKNEIGKAISQKERAKLQQKYKAMTSHKKYVEGS